MLVWEDWWEMADGTPYNPYDTSNSQGDKSVTVLAMQDSKTSSSKASTSTATIAATTISALALSLFACAYMQKRKVDAESARSIHEPLL